MRITRVLLDAASLDDVAGFYSDVLELPVDRTDTIVSIRVGDGLLEFVENATPATGVHHLAFLVSAEAFDAAVVWLRARVPLLSLDGADEFEGPATWNSRSVYFDGPDSSILELIARRDLPSPHRARNDFDAHEILGISEVGVAVADLEAVTVRLADDAGVPPFGSTSPDFAPTGAADGLLIVVAPGRTWFPTSDRTATERPTTVYATGGIPGRYALGSSAELVLDA